MTWLSNGNLRFKITSPVLHLSRSPHAALYTVNWKQRHKCGRYGQFAKKCRWGARWIFLQSTEWSESIEINKKPVCFQLDIGATCKCNVLPLKSFDQLGLKRVQLKGGSLHRSSNADFCCLHRFIIVMSIWSKNNFKSITINFVYFYEKLFQVTEIYFSKRYPMFKTLNIVWNTGPGVIKH